MTDTSDNPVAVLALNPAVDISYEIPQLLEYQKVCATRTRYYPGGNGINVSRALTELKVPMHCCSAIGGETGDLLLRLLGETLSENHSCFRLEGETRLNTNLMQQSPPGQYEITSIGPDITADILEDITACFLRMTGNGIGVLTGLLPPGVPETTYRKLAEKITLQGGRAVLDAYGKVLDLALEAAPFMVRLNRFSLEMAVKRRLDNPGDIATEARKIQQCGIKYLCISMGHSGAVLVDADNSYYCSAPKVHKQSTVGCGDSLVAGLITALVRSETSQQMLRFGVMCGSATAMHSGTSLFSRDELDVDALDIELSVLDI